MVELKSKIIRTAVLTLLVFFIIQMQAFQLLSDKTHVLCAVGATKICQQSKLSDDKRNGRDTTKISFYLPINLQIVLSRSCS